METVCTFDNGSGCVDVPLTASAKPLGLRQHEGGKRCGCRYKRLENDKTGCGREYHPW